MKFVLWYCKLNNKMAKYEELSKVTMDLSFLNILTALMTLVTHIMIFHSDSSGDIGHTHDFQFRLL
jgi:hypothetical protein